MNHFANKDVVKAFILCENDTKVAITMMMLSNNNKL